MMTVLILVLYRYGLNPAHAIVSIYFFAIRSVYIDPGQLSK